MLENSVTNREKAPSLRARRWLLFLMLLLAMGTATLILYGPSRQSPLSPLSPLPVDSWLEELRRNATDSLSAYFVAYPRRYTFILDEPDRCRQESPFVVLMIPVKPGDSEARRIIRETLGKENTVQGRGVSLYFLLGLSREGDGTGPIDEDVLAESRRHRDILQADFLDSYNNLTIKTMLMFEWLSARCPNTSYAMKIDSDIFLNVHNLVRLLSEAPRQLYVTGLVTRYAPVLRDPSSKWFLPFAVFPEPTYPPYVLGLGYVFSLDLAAKIKEASASVRALYIEDVYVGLCLRHLGVEVTDPPGGGLFQAWPSSWTSGCHWTSVITTMLEHSGQLLDVWGAYERQLQSGCAEL